MNQFIKDHVSSLLVFGATASTAVLLAAGLSVAAIAQDENSVTAADTEQARQNLALFDQLDFEAWNNRAVTSSASFTPRT